MKVVAFKFSFGSRLLIRSYYVEEKSFVVKALIQWNRSENTYYPFIDRKTQTSTPLKEIRSILYLLIMKGSFPFECA